MNTDTKTWKKRKNDKIVKLSINHSTFSNMDIANKRNSRQIENLKTKEKLSNNKLVVMLN